MILIGSAALNYHMSTTKDSVTDYDIIATPEERKMLDKSELRLDFQDVDFLNNSVVEKLFTDDFIHIRGVEIAVCSMRGLAAIKRSHLYRRHSFAKHINIYHAKLVEHYNDEDSEFVLERTRLTKLAVKQLTPSLNKTVKEFFDDKVTKKFDHDYIHEIVAYGDSPVYKRMQRDATRAWCDKDLWDMFSFETKLNCVAEEVYVIATERFMVPNNWDHGMLRAYTTSLEKVCTTLTSGWFRDFALDNYKELVSYYDTHKFETIKEILDDKTI